MNTVTAIQSFDHGGLRRRGDRFRVSPQTAEALRRAGLVEVLEGAALDPRKVSGETSSASPADQASPKQTVIRSGAGGKAAMVAVLS